MPEGEEEEQQIKNLFKQIIKENFPNLAEEIDFQEIQEAQRIPKNLDPRRHTPRHIIIKLPKIKDKERILEAAREKDTVSYKTKEFPYDCQLTSHKRLTGKKELASILSHER